MLPVLVLETGEPRWYPRAVVALCAAVVVALLITPLRWPYTVGVILATVAVLWRSWLQLRARARFKALQVYADFSMALVDNKGEESPVSAAGNNWASRVLIVLPLRLANGQKKQIVIARDRNDPDAFRRFMVLCRFGFAVNEGERHNDVQIHTTGA